ncbi:MAG: class I SAM-dependent methyltransferase [Verrucomicrobiae bacterium]|nr:class I SAM-dependent methyltransferase [Verrucomicrobiae bacterium]
MASDAAESAYLGASGSAYHHGKRSVPPAALPWIVRSRAALFQPWIRDSDAVFEFGCGFGWNLAGLRCAARAGYDISEMLRPEVESAGAAFVARLETLDAAAFDVAISHHSLEHVPEPLRTLGELGRILKPGGLLLLAVPWERERRYARFDPDEPNHHLFSWNVQTLGNLVTITGFQVESAGVRTYGYDRRAALIAVRWRLGAAGFHAVRSMLRALRPLKEVTIRARLEASA